MDSENEIKRQIGKNIKLIREFRGLSEAELGEKTEISENRIKLAEAGTAELSVIELAKIAQTCGMVFDIRFSQPDES